MNMIIPQKMDLIHTGWLYKILSLMFDDALIAKNMYFKGGTCAAMLSYLDRFSVDLDFDFIGNNAEMIEIRKKLEEIFIDIKLEVKDSSKNTLQYFLKYDVANSDGVRNARNSINIDAFFPVLKSNKYEPKLFTDIDRTIICQTKETMFAAKLVAVIGRYEKHGRVAGRDIYDIHHFFSRGFDYDKEVIEEATGMKTGDYLLKLYDFIGKNVTQTIIDQDLNHLLAYDNFKSIRKTLVKETLIFLKG